MLSELQGGSLVVTPINSADVESLCGYVNRALGALENATSSLEEAKRYVEHARDSVALLPNDTENVEEILENVRRLLGNAVKSIEGARGEISEVSEQFGQLIEFTSRSAPDDLVMAALHQSLTSRMLDEDYPSLEEQVRWGVEGVSAKLLDLERTVNDVLVQLGAEGLENLLGELLLQVESSTGGLLSKPTPKRWVTLITYSEDPPRRVENKMPVYLDNKDGGTIGLLQLILDGAKSNLNNMKQLSQQREPAPKELRELKIDKLSSRLGASSPEFTTDREQFYEVLPPSPINPSPGLSVFHEFKVKSISHVRRDPASWFGSPTATPIPLWFIGVTLYWGQWKSTLELEPGPIEEIFDFDNPSLPLAHGSDYVHKPLAYRWGMPEEPFRIEVVVVSLRPFTLSSS